MCGCLVCLCVLCVDLCVCLTGVFCVFLRVWYILRIVDVDLCICVCVLEPMSCGLSLFRRASVYP